MSQHGVDIEKINSNVLKKWIKTAFCYDGYLEKCTKAVWTKHCGFDGKWDPVIMTYDNLYSLDCNSSTCFDMLGSLGGKHHLSAYAYWNDQYAVASWKNFVLFDEETWYHWSLGGLPNWKEIITTVDPYFNTLFTCTTSGNVAIYDIWEPLFPKYCS